MREESELKASYTALIFEKDVGKGGHRFMKIENQTQTSNSIWFRNNLVKFSVS